MPRKKRIRIARGIYRVGNSLSAKLQFGSPPNARSSEQHFPLDTPHEVIEGWKNLKRSQFRLEAEARINAEEQAAAAVAKNGNNRGRLTPNQWAKQREAIRIVMARRKADPKDVFFAPALCRARRLKQIELERSLADELEQDGYDVFSPTVVCDRIAVINGKLFFVEFKKRGQDLRPGQALVQKLVPENYMIVYHD